MYELKNLWKNKIKIMLHKRQHRIQNREDEVWIKMNALHVFKLLSKAYSIYYLGKKL